MDTLTDILRYCLLILAGMFSGFVNVLAGAGGLIVLPVLLGVGLPISTANGTNRVSILMQDIAALIKFFKKNKLPLKVSLILSIPKAIGALIGAILASGISDKLLNRIVMSVLILMIIYVFFRKPECKRDERISDIDKSSTFKMNIVTFIIFLIIGSYAGFIQGGATLIWYAVLTWRFKYDMITADAIKLFLNFVMTPIALIVFIIHNQVNYLDGIILGVGSFVGAWIGARTAMRVKEKNVRIFMLVVLSAASIYMFFFKII